MKSSDFNARLLEKGASSADPEGDNGGIYEDKVRHLH